MRHLKRRLGRIAAGDNAASTVVLDFENGWSMAVRQRERLADRATRKRAILKSPCGRVVKMPLLGDESNLGRPTLAVEREDQQASLPRKVPRTGLADDMSVAQSLRSERDRTTNSKAQV